MVKPTYWVLLGLIAQCAYALELELPVDINDVGYLAFGVAPYGYHVAEHRYDGHPGFDFEFIPGRKVRAAHGGTFRYTSDVRDPNLKTVTIEFQENGNNYQTFYTNIQSLEPGIDNNVAVITGQVFGTPASVVRNLGNAGSFTYGMTHFQLADNRVRYGLSNVSALSPEPYFSPSARQTLAQIWQNSQYSQMICEPFLSAPRGDLPNPYISRRWQRDAGTHAEIVEFLCDYNQNDPNTAYQYRLLDSSGNTLETGTVFVSPVPAGISLLDLQPTNGNKRLGLVYVKDGSMQLDYSAPGGSRPTNIFTASHYSTTAALNCASKTDSLCFSGNSSPYRSGDLLDIRIAIEAGKLAAGVTSADLWVGIVLPSGEMLFARSDKNWLADPQPILKNLSLVDVTVPVLSIVIPADLGAGNYMLYAALNQSGKGIDNLTLTLASNIARGLIYIAP
jgi:hypothetical protein